MLNVKVLFRIGRSISGSSLVIINSPFLLESLQLKILLKMFDFSRLSGFTVLIRLKRPLDKKNYNEPAPSVFLLNLCEI